MFGSKIVRRFAAAGVLGLLVLFALVWLTTLPVIRTIVTDMARDQAQDALIQVARTLEHFQPDQTRRQVIRRLISQTPVAGTGYLFAFDSDNQMIIHPDPELEGSDFGSRREPLTGDSIAMLLRGVADAGEPLEYIWDHPERPGVFEYRKLAWVEYNPEWDLYIAASVYERDLYAGIRQIQQRLLLIGFGALLVLLAGLAWAVLWLIRPIIRIAEVAEDVATGNLDAAVDIERSDEIGSLAQRFNAMVASLKSHIGRLDERVRNRTQELSQSVRQLEYKNRSITRLSVLGNALRHCEDHRAVYRLLEAEVPRLFRGSGGALYLHDSSTKTYVLRAQWGHWPHQKSIEPPACCALLVQEKAEDANRWRSRTIDDCERLLQRAQGATLLCVPLIVEGHLRGFFHHCLHQAAPDDMVRRICEMLAESVSLTISNIELRECLHAQSIRDPLTGLYNRRYIAEAFVRESSRAARSGEPFSIALLDIDHFKYFNDTYGHNAGDEVLREIGALLLQATRSEDIVGRWGGEEFLLLLPGICAEGALQLANRLRDRVRDELRISSDGQPLPALSISGGVTAVQSGSEDLPAAVYRADQGLYRSKSSGRDCVHLARSLADSQGIQTAASSPEHLQQDVAQDSSAIDPSASVAYKH